MKSQSSQFLCFISIVLPPNSIMHVLEATEDVFLKDNTSKSHHNFLMVGSWNDDPFPIRRSLLRFQDIPSSCQYVILARIYIRVWRLNNGDDGRPIQARQVLRSWREDEATRDLRYVNAPWKGQYLSIDDADASSYVDDMQIITTPLSSDYFVWDITVAARSWLAGQPNHGILLMASGEHYASEITFYSRENLAGQVPYLKVFCKSYGKV